VRLILIFFKKILQKFGIFAILTVVVVTKG